MSGETPGLQPAAPGSYGEPPAGGRLPAATGLGVVRLLVSDLERSLAFYESVLGLRVLVREPKRAVLGAQEDTRALLELNPGAQAAPERGRLGLYHFALLLPDRAALGRLVRHFGQAGVRVGAADHRVSEALYLNDPDGLGIEVYADRPRSAWRRSGRELVLATDPLAVEELLRAAGAEPWRGMPRATVVGHVHLHVGDLGEAAAFYSDALGFDRMSWSYPGALFLGAGGYHHHLGTNTWAGPQARPRAAEEAGLLEWTLEVPAVADVAALRARLAERGYDFTNGGEDSVTQDPWGTRVRVHASEVRS